MDVYMTEEETKELSKIKEKESNDAIIILVVDIHSKNIWIGIQVGRIITNVYEFRYHSDNSNIFKELMARYYDDVNNAFHFILFELFQLTTIVTYRHQIKFKKNYLASMAIIPIHGVTKCVMEEEVNEKLLKVAAISRLEDTHMVVGVFSHNFFVSRCHLYLFF